MARAPLTVFGLQVAALGVGAAAATVLLVPAVGALGRSNLLLGMAMAISVAAGLTIC